jgi:hypothetical protein
VEQSVRQKIRILVEQSSSHPQPKRSQVAIEYEFSGSFEPYVGSNNLPIFLLKL